MQLLSANNWNLLKADFSAIVFLSEKGAGHVTHMVRVSKGWNILDIPGQLELKAGMPPGNMSSGLGGSPIIPLAEQDELEAGEDDLGSMLEPARREYKDGDPFAFSAVEDPLLPKNEPPLMHGVTPFSRIHGPTTNSQKRGVAPFSRIHGITPYSRRISGHS